MPRTPAPLTVEQLRLRGRYAWWNLTDSEGNVIAEFREEADARAFVALPALENDIRHLVKEVLALGAFEQGVIEVIGVTNYRALTYWMHQAKAALAAADGPSPKE